MGVVVRLDGKRVHENGYRVQESSMPLAGGDSSGAVGTIELDLVDLPYHPIGLNVERSLTLADTNRGSTLGTVRDIGDSAKEGARYNIMASNRLGEFNIETQVQPFTGTLENAFRYYCSLANLNTGILVDTSIALRQVNFPGWNGNLWNHMKMMATGMGTDLNLISNNIVLRPVRLFEAIRNRQVDSTATISSTDLALKQEVLWYETQYVASGLIYPAGGWREDITPLSVPAGVTVETRLDDTKDVLSSIFSLEQPVCKQLIGPADNEASVYTVVGDDGIVIMPDQWRDYGGSLSVAVSADTRAIIVTLTGASGLYQTNGEPMRTFRIGLSSGTSTSDTYSTLRVRGRHIALNARSLILPTGVPEWRTGQEFAPTIDNPFLNTLEAAYSAGVRGARRYAGRTMTVSASVSALNKRGETGTANYPPYSEVQALWQGKTYGQVKAEQAGKTYAMVQDELYASVQDSFDNQVFGNAPGARYWDQETRRWYRVRDSTIEWGTMSIEADDDLTHADMQGKFNGMTYAQVTAHYQGMTYYQATVRGMA